MDPYEFHKQKLPFSLDAFGDLVEMESTDLARNLVSIISTIWQF